MHEKYCTMVPLHIVFVYVWQDHFKKFSMDFQAIKYIHVNEKMRFFHTGFYVKYKKVYKTLSFGRNLSHWWRRKEQSVSLKCYLVLTNISVAGKYK